MDDPQMSDYAPPRCGEGYDCGELGVECDNPKHKGARRIIDILEASATHEQLYPEQDIFTDVPSRLDDPAYYEEEPF